MTSQADMLVKLQLYKYFRTLILKFSSTILMLYKKSIMVNYQKHAITHLVRAQQLPKISTPSLPLGQKHMHLKTSFPYPCVLVQGWLNGLWFMIHVKVIDFHNQILWYHEPFHDKVKNQSKDISGLIKKC